MAVHQPVAPGGGGGPPSGPAGGDLAGSTYPNPTIALLAVTNAKMAAGAAAANLGAPGGDLGGAAYPTPTVVAITETSGPTRLLIGAIVDGQFLKRVGGTLVSAAVGAGTVTSVSSGDTSLVVTNPTTTPSVQIAAPNVYFTNVAPAASVPMNTQKFTGLAAGTGNGDSVRYEQAVKSGDTAAGDLGGTYPNPTVTAIHETSGPTKLTIGTVTDGQFLKRVGTTLVSAAVVVSVAATDASIVVAGTATAPTIATGTLDVIAAQHPPAASWSNNSKKITSLANGSAATDAAAFGQLVAAPVAFTSTGTWTPSTTGQALFAALVVGGGGGGGKGGASAGGTGGGGGQVLPFYYLGNVVGNQTVTIGAAGTGSTGTNATAGGDTSIGALAVAAGGAAGVDATNAAGVAGGNTAAGTGVGAVGSGGAGSTTSTAGLAGGGGEQNYGAGGGGGGGPTSAAGGAAGARNGANKFTGGTGASLGGGGGASGNANGGNGSAGAGGTGANATDNTGNGGGGGGAGTAGGNGGNGGKGYVVIFQIA